MNRKILILPLILLAISCSTARKTSHPSETPTRVVYKTHKVIVHERRIPTDPMLRRIDSLCYTSMMDSTQLGIMIYDLTADQILYQLNQDQRMRPASCMKLVTAITALDMLGEDYSFTPTVTRAGWGWCWDDSETRQIPYKEKQTQTLAEILYPVLKNSDNLKAESIFAQISLKASGKLSDRKSAAQCISALISATGLDPNHYTIADGSGLSLYNYVSPHMLVNLLKYAWRNEKIRPVLYDNLPIAGVDGTIEKRMTDTKAYNNVHAKTGSVTAISSLSGYCHSNKTGHDLCFSIINQGLRKMSTGRNFQDKVCAILCE